MKTQRIIILAAVLCALAVGLGYTYKCIKADQLLGPESPPSTELEDIPRNGVKLAEPAPEASLEIELEVPKAEPLTQFNIAMPFFTQAPHSNWDYPWQEACEEASILLVANLYQNLDLNADSFNEGLLNLVDWQMQNFGAYEHSSVAQTVQMIEANFGLSTSVHKNPSFEDIQNILNKGNLIVAPFAGKELKNPNFKNGGPNYHMSVIKGYDTEKMHIVTHDVGTRNGANYVYSWDTIERALHDWHDDNILLGESLIIEVHRP